MHSSYRMCMQIWERGKEVQGHRGRERKEGVLWRIRGRGIERLTNLGLFLAPSF